MAYHNLTTEVLSIWESWEKQKRSGFKNRCRTLTEAQIKGDKSGNITGVDMQKDCPAATRERLSMAQEIAKSNEAELRTKTESLQALLQSQRAAGVDTTATEAKLRTSLEARKLNLKNIDRLESIQSDYAKKYTPSDDKYDQRAHSLYLEKMRDAMRERLAQEQSRELPDFDRIDALTRRLGRVDGAMKKSDEWLATNDPKYKERKDAKKFASQGAVQGSKAPKEKANKPSTQGATGATGAAAPAPDAGATGAAAPAPVAGTPEKTPKGESAEDKSKRVAAKPGSVWETETGFGAKRMGPDTAVGSKEGSRYFKKREDAEVYSKLTEPEGSRRKIPERKPVEKKPKKTPRTVPSAKSKKPRAKPGVVESLAIEIVGKHLVEKWSQKYKDSINCDNPKGFSQRAHCQGKELTEENISALAKKHGVSPKSIEKQLRMGTEVEKEHTSNEQEARKIALDHLAEVPDYYSKLKKYVEPTVNETYRDSGLGKWFEGESATDEPGWDRYNTAGKRVGKCGDAEEGEAYAACLSKQKAKKLGKEGISSFVKRKRAAQKKHGMAKKGEGEAGGGDAPVRVSTGIDKIDEAVEEVSMEEMVEGIKTLIKLIKDHEKRAYEAKKTGDKIAYRQHRAAIADYSADIRTVKKMIAQAEAKLRSIKEEAEDKPLNKPFRTPGEKKKFAVYVSNDNGNIVKVRFGDPNMSIKRDNPDRLKAFRSRHSCDDDVGPKWKARYWSCQMWRSDKSVNDILGEASENEPTNPELWEKVQDLVAGRSSSMEHNGETITGPNDGKGFDVHPSAYSNAWASKLYKRLGGGWRKAE